jgi:hypothetical protein
MVSLAQSSRSLITRVQTTCKTSAFGGPHWTRYDKLLYHNELSPMELLLCAAYERHGRNDLADCVRNARVHQRLDSFISAEIFDRMGTREELLGRFYGLFKTFHPDSKEDPPVYTSPWSDVEQWMKKLEIKFASDEGLSAMKALPNPDLKGWPSSRVV